MTHQASESSPPSGFAGAEQLVKLATAILGTLYVLGLLISNFQLMALDIADFGSLQAKNILTGFIFCMWVLLLVVIIMPVAVIPACLLYIFAFTSVSTTRKFISSALAILSIAFIGGFVLYLCGLIVGYLYPGGRQWIAGMQAGFFDFRFMMSDLAVSMQQLATSFWHPKILMAGIFILVIQAALFVTLVFRFARPDDFAAVVDAVREYLFAAKVFLACLLAITVLPLLLFEYSEQVYPNLKYNLGGGQPQIVDLILSGKKSDLAGFPNAIRLDTYAQATLRPPRAGERKDGDREESVKIEKVAAWYQSDKFLYVANLPGHPPQGGAAAANQTFAIDLKLIRNISNLPMYVRVKEGGQIVSVHPL